MKSSPFIALMALAATHASAIPDAEAEPHHRWGFCGPPGMGCSVDKREADPHHRWGFCGPPGMGCSVDKREAEPNPHHRWGFCGPPGMGCSVDKRSVDEAAVCGAPGHPCHAVKQAAVTISDVLNKADEAAKSTSFCSVEGQPCHKANGYLAKIAEKARESYAKVWAREAAAVAEAYPRGRYGFCSAPGQACLGGKETPEADKHRDKLVGCEPGKFCPVGVDSHDPESMAVKGGKIGLTGEYNTPWLVGRDRSMNPKRGNWIGFTHDKTKYSVGGSRAADDENDLAHDIRWCNVPSAACLATNTNGDNVDIDGFCDGPHASCAVGRDALAHIKNNPELAKHLSSCGANGTPCLVTLDDAGVTNDTTISKRSAEASPHHRWGFCGPPGMGCSVDKRSPLGTFIGGKRDPTAVAAPGGRWGFCGPPGAGCSVDKRSVGPAPFCPANIPCLSGEDAQQVVSIITGNDPKFLNRECYKNGNECDTILKIHAAFNQLQQETQLAKHAAKDPNAVINSCQAKGAKCSVLQLRHASDLSEGKGKAHKAEGECYGPQGYCYSAKRDLEELRTYIEQAVQYLADQQNQ